MPTNSPSEPPLLGVGDVSSTPDFTSVGLSWDAVEGATLYVVKIQPVGAADWTTVSNRSQYFPCFYWVTVCQLFCTFVLVHTSQL